jgi:hypothetical protein
MLIIWQAPASHVAQFLLAFITETALRPWLRPVGQSGGTPMKLSIRGGKKSLACDEATHEPIPRAAIGVFP